MNRPDLDILRSVIKKLTDLFEDGEMFEAPFNVYTDGDMRLGTRPNFPYIYLLTFGRLFQVEHLPVIIVQLTINSSAFEMGGDEALDVELNLHIFGRDAAQTASLKGALRNQIHAWTIYNFDAQYTPILEECDIITDDQGNTWTESFHSISGEGLALEASLMAWSTMSCYFRSLIGV